MNTLIVAQWVAEVAEGVTPMPAPQSDRARARNTRRLSAAALEARHVVECLAAGANTEREAGIAWRVAAQMVAIAGCTFCAGGEA